MQLTSDNDKLIVHVMELYDRHGLDLETEASASNHPGGLLCIQPAYMLNLSTSSMRMQPQDQALGIGQSIINQPFTPSPASRTRGMGHPDRKS